MGDIKNYSETTYFAESKQVQNKRNPLLNIIKHNRRISENVKENIFSKTFKSSIRAY